MQTKKYYKCLDIIRIISCVAVLFYHLDFLKGGCLAVCSFFTLSGYLSCVTNFDKEKFSLLKYYKNRFFKIYIPIVVIIFTTILATTFFQNIKIINLKEEVKSILLGYNNFWQLNANIDYFSEHINSPFMHFWYIAILLQFETIFPFIFIILKKIGDKTNEEIPIVATFILATASVFLFYKLCLDSSVMDAYYNSFAHSFSWLFGISLGFCHCYNKNLMPIKINNQKVIKIIFTLYLAIQICLFICINEKSGMFGLAMSVTTILTISLIDYGAMIKNENNKILKLFSTLTYEIYLVQYPMIFICDQIPIFEKIYFFKLLAILILILASAFLVHFSLNKIKKHKALTILMRIAIFAITAFGIYKFVLAKDYSSEMTELEKELEKNKILMEQKQKESVQSALAYNESILENFENEKENLNEKIKNLPIMAFGDSIMLGASTNLYELFPNIYIDAKKSRTTWDIYEPVKKLAAENKFGEIVVIHLGTNGPSSENTKDAILELIGNREIFWLNVTNDKVAKVNAKLKEYAKKHSNVHIVDWESFAKGHDEYFAPDGIHLVKAGRQEYAKLIFDTIYSFYYEKLTMQTKEAQSAKAAEEERIAKIAELQKKILAFLAKKKNSKNEIIVEFICDECPQDFIRACIDELEQNNFIAANKKGVYALTKNGKAELKKSKTE